MKSTHFFVLVIFFCLIIVSSLVPEQQSLDYSKIIGTWELKVDTGEEYLYYYMKIEEAEDSVRGWMGEDLQIASAVLLAEITFDGETLNFEVTAPTPPDGVERLVKCKFKVGESKLDGLFILQDIDVTVIVTARRIS